MTSLLDIAPAVETVSIGDVPIECNGISAGDLVRLLQRFPGLREALWNGRAETVDRDTIDASSLIAMAPDAIAAVLAAGTGHAGDLNEEKAAARIPIEGQLDLLTTILRLTLPQGLGPFVTKLTVLFGAVGEAQPRLRVSGYAEDDARPLPNGKDSGTPSPSPLNA